MPSNNRIRLDERKRIAPARLDAGYGNPEKSVSIADFGQLLVALYDEKLLTKN